MMAHREHGENATVIGTTGSHPAKVPVVLLPKTQRSAIPYFSWVDFKGLSEVMLDFCFVCIWFQYCFPVQN